MNANRGDVKGVMLRNASDRNVESDLAIRMRENTTVGEGYTNRSTWFGRNLEE